jgi:hypothetical protein
MSDFILDSDPIIPTGVPATPVEVGLLILADTLPADSIPLLSADQQPTPVDLGQAAVISDMPTAEAVAVFEDAGLTVELPDA